MQKFIVSLFMSLTLVLPGLGQAAPPNRETGKIKVVSTIFAPYDFARAVAGDRAELTMLLPPGAESHSFEPTPRDIVNIQKCDVFIYIGGESETWVEQILKSTDTGKRKTLALMDKVTVVKEEIVEGMQEESEEEETEEPEYDEHIWTSPKNAKLLTQAIADTLSAADPDNAAFYQENAKDYIVKLNKLDKDFQAVVDGAVRKTIVFGDRFPFRYFADDYKLSYFAAFPGCSTETEPSAATLVFLINKVKQGKIPVVFHIELSNEKIADMLCEATGAKKRLLHACHNISRDDFRKGETYLSIMARNVEALREALW
ncbi:MAG: metal ABC transporter substrate-binding protein [Acidaminococcales bacterium]|nr:metal ABC transporter substrate-binding protein [Acidaminococcales bacterium]